MAESKRKKILDAALKAILASSETAWWLKGPATFISELSGNFDKLLQDEQKALNDASSQEFTEALSQHEDYGKFIEAIKSENVRIEEFVAGIRDEVKKQTGEIAALRNFAETFACSLEEFHKTLQRVDQTTTGTAVDVKSIADDVKSINDKINHIQNFLEQKTITISDQTLHTPIDEKQSEVSPLVNELKTLIEKYSSDPSSADNPQVRLAQAAIANAQQKFDQTLDLLSPDTVESELEDTIEQATRTIEENRLRAYAHYGRREWKQAIVCYERILQLQPDDVHVRFKLSDCYNRLGMLNDAVLNYSACIEQLKPSVEENGEIELTHLLAGCFGNRGNALNKDAKYNDAIHDYDEAIKYYTQLVKNHNRIDLVDDLAMTYSNMGILYYEQHLEHKAIRAYDEAIKMIDRFVKQEDKTEYTYTIAMIHNNRSNAYAQLKLYVKAISDCDTTISKYKQLIEKEGRTELAEEQVMNYMNRGNVLNHLTRFNLALSDFEQAVQDCTRLVEQEGRSELSDKLASIHINMTNFLRNQERYVEAKYHGEEAVKILRKFVVEENRTQFTHILAISYITLASVYFDQDNLDDAENNCLEGINILNQLIKKGNRQDLIPLLTKARNNLQAIRNKKKA